MKRDYGFVGSREVKNFLKLCDDQWGAHPRVFKDGVLVQNKERFFLVTRDIDGVPLDRLRINNMGLYVAEVKDDQIRLSLEGSKLVGEVATKNVVEFSLEQGKAWLKGEDIPFEGDFPGFQIIKCGNDFLGSGKWKEGRFLNFVPKARRLIEIH